MRNWRREYWTTRILLSAGILATLLTVWLVLLIATADVPRW